MADEVDEDGHCCFAAVGVMRATWARSSRRSFDVLRVRAAPREDLV